MNREFTIEQPADFISVITEIFDWYKKTDKKDTLVLALSGDLGAGKTTFTQELGKFLGVTEYITSPTFTIMKQYEFNHELFDYLFHIDAYRIEDEGEIVPLRLREVVVHPRSVVCIEWPEQMPTLIPESAVMIDISIGIDEKRLVKVRAKD